MNMFARFDKNPAMTLQDIKVTKRYGRTDVRMHGQRENSIPTTNKVCGGYNQASVTTIIHEFIKVDIQSNKGYLGQCTRFCSHDHRIGE